MISYGHMVISNDRIKSIQAYCGSVCINALSRRSLKMLSRILTAGTVLGAFAVGALPCAAATDAKPPGVVGDGVVDDTIAVQRALDAAGKSGGEVYLPPGQYLIKGSLTVPTGVDLRGSWNAPHHGAWDKGTTLMITGGRGREDGPAAVTLSQTSSLHGVTMLWPDQRADNIVAYPWAVHGSGMHNTVENVTFVNAYQGISIGKPWSELHMIRNIDGCVLRRGISIDSTSDVGRIENVHFNTHYWMRSGYPAIQSPDAGKLVPEYTMKHLDAFIFGRTDWEYVANTFVWGAHIGYRFIQTPDGACNGQFMGIGADACDIGLKIEGIQPFGIQVTNGEFTAFAGSLNAGIVVAPGAGGAAQFVNCNFWSTPGGAVRVNGDTQVTVNACHFGDTGSGGEIIADHGRLVVSGCSFAQKGKAVVLKPGVRSALITANSQPGGLVVDNGVGSVAQMSANEVPYVYPSASTQHYRIAVGSPQGEDFLDGGWWGGEGADDVPGDLKGAVSTARWTKGNAALHLPVKPGTAYTLTLWALSRDKTPPVMVSIPGARGQTIPAGKTAKLTFSIPASATKGRNMISVAIQGVSWSPSKIWPGNTDTRRLGLRVFAVEMRAAGASDAVTDLK